SSPIQLRKPTKPNHYPSHLTHTTPSTILTLSVRITPVPEPILALFPQAPQPSLHRPWNLIVSLHRAILTDRYVLPAEYGYPTYGVVYERDKWRAMKAVCEGVGVPLPVGAGKFCWEKWNEDVRSACVISEPSFTHDAIESQKSLQTVLRTSISSCLTNIERFITDIIPLLLARSGSHNANEPRRSVWEAFRRLPLWWEVLEETGFEGGVGSEEEVRGVVEHLRVVGEGWRRSVGRGWMEGVMGRVGGET
ncbi:hypothetical protein HDV00_010375, partial [Rhizophlyctis rosea]